jgi:hypothetical protein
MSETESKPNTIDKKITSYKVVIDKEISLIEKEPISIPLLDIETLHEGLVRPEMLLGSTYKIKPHNSEHALYITINDVVLNKDTNDEIRKPYEIFINSKNMEHFQWVIALTRIISGVFRKGGNIIFLIDELKAVFDPKGGYFKKGGLFMPSLVAEIGYVIEKHFIMLGIIKKEELTKEQIEFIEDKKKQHSDKYIENYPEKSIVCISCNVKASVLLDGCMTCLACGYSKCG